MTSRGRTVRLAVGGALLALLTAAAFWPVLAAGFVNYDDVAYVTLNDHVQQGISADGLRWAWTTLYAGNWHPLTWMSHMLDWTLYGSNPLGHHLTSLLLHLASVIFLFLLLEDMTGAPGESAFVAALFAVHPLHVESVAWIAERKDVLSGLLWMLATWAYVRYAKRGGTRRYLILCALFALGLAAKPMLVTLPLVFLLLDFWPLGRWGRGEAPASNRTPVPRLVLEKTPLLALSASSCVITFLAQRSAGMTMSLEILPLGVRLSNAAVAYFRYLGKAIWPVGLAVFYPHPGRTLAPLFGAGAALGLAALTALAVRSRVRRPYLFTGWFWFAGTLVPVIGLVQVGSQSIADRYTYIPLVGIFLIAAWGASDAWRALGAALPVLKRRRPWLALPAAGVILVLGWRTSAQCAVWRDSRTLFEHALAVTSGNAVALHYLGLVFADEGRLENATRLFEEAVRLRPNYSRAQYNLGRVLAAQARVAEAAPHYQRAVAIDPQFAEAHNGLGLALAAQGRFAEAIDQHQQALRINPEYTEAYNNLGVALAALGRNEEAIAQYERALRLRPDYSEALNNLGCALTNAGRIDEAIDRFTLVLRSRPSYAKAHSNFAAALFRAGRYTEAWNEVHAARRLGFEPPGRLLQVLAEKMADPQARSR